MVLTAVTLTLDPGASDRIAALWRHLAATGHGDSQLRLGYRPHLTLLLTAGLEVERARRVLPGLLPAGGLPLAFTGVEVFRDSGVLWAVVPPSELLLALQATVERSIGAEPLPHYRSRHWVPHCTLASGLTGEALAAARAAAEAAWSPFEGRGGGLELVRFPPVEVLLPADGA